jgi:hypothetical protein
MIKISFLYGSTQISFLYGSTPSNYFGVITLGYTLAANYLSVFLNKIKIPLSGYSYENLKIPLWGYAARSARVSEPSLTTL